MIRILQINMHRSATAHELLAQFAAETKADLVLISEQYRNKGPVSWHPDISGTAAIWVRDGTLLGVLAQGRGDGFVWIRCSGITFFSVYLTPNETMPDFRRRLEALEDAILSTDGRILVGVTSMLGHLNGACLTQIPEGNEFWKWRREQDW